ncbi:MAG: class B sortase [Clostridiales bacterium]|nr:class B sortase [Clostridiales bacterium]
MKKKICIAMIVALSILFTLSAAYLFTYYQNLNKENDAYDDLINIVDDEENNPVDKFNKYAKLYEQNNDFIGWIKIDKTNINYPVMQTPDNPNYYLKHNFNKEYSSYGCPYLQENCSVNTDKSNLIIYGHNMKDGAMFSNLTKYSDYDFYTEHKYIQFDTLDSENTYKIVYVFKTVSGSFEYNKYTSFGNEEVFNEFIEKCEKLSLYRTDEAIKYGDNLITLSTCEYTRKNSRFVVIAKKV